MHIQCFKKSLPHHLLSKFALIILTAYHSLITLVQAAMDLSGVTISNDPFP